MFNIAFRKRFWKKLIFFNFKLMFLIFLDYFNVLILKKNLKNKKNIILIYFKIKNNNYQTFKHQFKIDYLIYLLLWNLITVAGKVLVAPQILKIIIIIIYVHKISKI
jgi:hypothetical protein